MAERAHEQAVLVAALKWLGSRWRLAFESADAWKQRIAKAEGLLARAVADWQQAEQARKDSK